MWREIFTQEDLQLPRSVSELNEFLAMIFEKIQLDNEVKKMARERRGLYKPLIEELWPLSNYFRKTYFEEGYRLAPQIGNQGFDAIIRDAQGTQVEQIEVSWPIDGHKHAEVVRLLNEKGRGPIEVFDPLQKLEELFRLVLSGAQKKAARDYKTQGLSSLVLVVSLFPYFFQDIPEHQMAFKNFVRNLSGIKYQVDKVVLLISTSWEVITIV
jgi:hypothetical protein